MKWSFFFLWAMCVHAGVIYICPPMISADPEQLFFDPTSARDEIAKPFCALKEALEGAGFEVRFISADPIPPCTAVLVFNETCVLSRIREHPRERCLFFILEPPFVLPAAYNRQLKEVFGKIFVLFDHLVDNKNYFKFYYPQPRQKMLEQIPRFEDKKLCAMIAGNRPFHHLKALYRERERAARFFGMLPDDFDLYGAGWDYNPAWRGTVPNKWDVLQRYRFSLCYENMQNQLGYITEKIFDCFVAGCVPVYWGASNIAEYVPPACFIDRQQFASNQKLYAFLKAMDAETYETYLKAIRDYFASPQAQLFSIQHFVDLILKEVSQL